MLKQGKNPSVVVMQTPYNFLESMYTQTGSSAPEADGHINGRGINYIVQRSPIEMLEEIDLSLFFMINFIEALCFEFLVK